MTELSPIADAMDWDVGYFTLVEDRAEVVAALRELADWYEAGHDQTLRRCLDCSEDTQEINEYYMVNDDVWTLANPEVDGMLCVGCLETRLGRRLSPEDFMDAPVNFDGVLTHSPRLQDRMGWAA